MSEATPEITKSGRCPECEYDLHGNTSGRCPECGTSIGSAAFSRLPWIYRRARGGIRAYAQMLGMLLLKPWQLSAEMERRVLRRPAARFHQESVALATFLGAGLLAIAFLMRGPRWDDFFNTPLGALLANRQGRALLWLPMVIWSDQLLMLIPLVPAIYVALHATAWMYRCMLRLVYGNSPVQRRRAERVGYYLSGLAPILAVLLGTLFIMSMVVHEQLDLFIGRWGPIVRRFRPVFALLALAVFCFPTLIILFKGNNRRVGRAVVALALFPLIQVIAWGTIGFAVFWMFGYAALAVWSMTH